MTGPDRLSAEPEAARSLVASSGGLPVVLCAAGAVLTTHLTWSFARLIVTPPSARESDDGAMSNDVFDTCYAGLSAGAQLLYRLLGGYGGHDITAQTALLQARDLAVQARAHKQYANVLVELADLAAAQRPDDAGLPLLREAYDIYTDLGSPAAARIAARLQQAGQGRR